VFLEAQQAVFEFRERLEVVGRVDDHDKT
jgi:hypothetical protein